MTALHHQYRGLCIGLEASSHGHKLHSMVNRGHSRLLQTNSIEVTVRNWGELCKFPYVTYVGCSDWVYRG
jgi:hypothetical protein